ncbi:dihydroneopterin aldolase [Azohydromonas lata]|uniref:7,8-dihydroneopterin aldolase n=1 Tax=Azohydromonas lata TaxID=45677 RepID=A0ABU5IPP9_9BURK|nr:dihydroneopterin aldolase [Azohydromonas lata]MDZ5460863.1 dihydroneopterin aldolase [Azohydromonas lata]
MLNRIVLRRLMMDARIGVYAWEKEAPQPIVVDLEFDLPHGDACFSDDLADTVDYAAIVERLRAVALTQPHRLVEAMAQTMCTVLQTEFDLQYVRLTLMKLAPFPGSEVGIVVERERAPDFRQEAKFFSTSRETA